MKYLTIFIFFFLLLIGGCSNDQADEIQEDSAKSEEEVYFEDYAVDDKKWGYLDPHGDIIIPAIFDAARNFKNGLAPVNFEGKWGIINTSGNWTIPPEFQGIWEFSDGLARVKVFDRGLGFVNDQGEIIIEPDFEEVYDYSFGMARFQEGGYYGYINTSGAIVIPATYESASDFIGDYAVTKKDGSYGLINADGDWILSNSYQRIQYDQDMEGILVKQNNRYRHLTILGRNLFDRDYIKATPFYHERAWVLNSKQWDLIDQKGHKLASHEALQIIYAGSNRWILQQDSGFTITNSNGDLLVEKLYAQINKYSDNRAVFFNNPMWGYLDLSGFEVIDPRYFLIWDFKEGLARVADESGIHFIDTAGETVIRQFYSDARDFFENRARFQEQ